MKTTIYNFGKVSIVLLFFIFGIQYGFSQIDADISLLSGSPPPGSNKYDQKDSNDFWLTNKIVSPVYVYESNLLRKVIFELELKKTLISDVTFFAHRQIIEHQDDILDQGKINAKNIVIEVEAIPNGFQFELALN
jgi:hypothetical protein